MTTRATLPMIDGARVVVPDSVDLITPYVLREQGDWFEDEIKFVRGVLEPGQQAIDIGANYGVYALSIAKAIGATGRLWAFEPASTTADFLAAGIAENAFGHVVLERCALSSEIGTASLSLNVDSELNALEHGTKTTAESELVRLVTLDERAAVHAWQGIDFVNIDAEGEELNILRGGSEFFAAHSPLVLYEIKAGNELHLELIEAFAQRGYHSYRLVPGLGVLTAHDANAATDGYLLNLFCCKPDRAALLAAKGLLVEAASLSHSLTQLTDAMPADRYHWPQSLAPMPYAQSLIAQWQQTMAAGSQLDLVHALAWHAMSRDAALPAANQLAALHLSFDAFQRLCAGPEAHLQLLSLARVAREIGARSIAVEALGRFLNIFRERRAVDLAEPFLAPGIRFDAVAPGNEAGNWALAGALEEFERCNAFSSFYTGESAQKRVAMICDLGFASGEMQRRRELLALRFGAGG